MANIYLAAMVDARTDSASIKKISIPFTIFAAFAITFAKISILCFYLRIFSGRLYRVLICGLIVFQILTLLENVILTFLLCAPPKLLWNKSANPLGECLEINAVSRWRNFPNILSDIVMLVLPIPPLWRLQLSQRDKIGITVAFSMGSM